MTTPFLFVSKKFWSLACLVLLVAITTSSTSASTATATISKTVAVPLPSTTNKPNSPYVEFSSYNNCSSPVLSDEDITEEVVVAEKKETPMLKAVYQWYLESCVRKPFLAKGLTSGTIAALGDAIAQKIEASASSSRSFNPNRVATFFFCNLLFTGPTIHLWYTFLNRVGQRMEQRFQVSKWKQTATQLFLDQTLGVAFFPLYIYVYEVFDSVIRLHSLPSVARATQKCKNHLWGIVMTQYRVFPISNLINFGLVPYELRVLFTSTVSLFWNIYLCSVVSSSAR